MTDSSAPSKNDTILVVDDQPNNLKVIASLLDDEYNLSFAQNGLIALKNIDQIKPNLILLDIMMPKLNGFEVCKQLKSLDRHRDVPIIFLTAKTSIEDVMKGFDCGGVDYITKPFNQKDMKVRIRNHLNLYHARNKLNIMNEQLKVSEKNLRITNQQLEKTNQEKDKFFSILAHDLKNPFQSILGFSKLLLKKLDDFTLEEIKSFVSSIHDSSENTYGLLEELLQWAKMQQGKMDFNPHLIPLKDICESCFNLLDLAAQHKRIKLSYIAPENIVVYADKTKVESMIRNIAGNAIKFTHENGRVNLNAESVEDKVKISISDTGIGMNEEKVASLFRLSKVKSEDGTNGEEGTGLGLIISHEFARMHGTQLYIDSSPGEGTIISFYLPSHPS